MEGMILAPWLPPAAPDLARLAMAAADRHGWARVAAWPEWRKGGIAVSGLPPFLPWLARSGAATHLVLVQARELGALVPGARILPLPSDWLASLDLPALAAPLAEHPDFPGASVHVVRVLAPGQAQVRTWGGAAPEAVQGVLARLSGRSAWSLEG